MQGATVIQIGQNVADIYRAFDFLPYRTYTYNRLMHPRISPKQWKTIFSAEAVDRYEARLQQHLSRLFRAKLHQSQVALFKAGCEEHRETIEFISDLYIVVRLSFDGPPVPITENRLRELEASYLAERSCA